MTDAFPHPYTAANALSFIEYASKGKPIHIFAIDVNGTAVGSIGIHPQSDIMKMNAELGYWLGEAYWGKGIVPAAVKQVVAFAFATYNINRIYARPFGTNLASQRVLEKCGFTLDARINGNINKYGETLDELIYSVRK